jgi:TRAP-type mannitol/chloroaromatic compound transport system permease small subunit
VEAVILSSGVAPPVSRHNATASPYNRVSFAAAPLPARDAESATAADRRSATREVPVNALLALSRAIDALTERIGRFVYWLILAVVLISAANATVRKAFNYSSNAYLEIQWYLFSFIFLIGAGYVFMRNEHVRIDIVTGRMSARVHNWIDVIGIVFFLFPMSLIIMWLSWPLFVDSWVRNEVSTNAGGLTIWPARLMVPVGFFLLILQGVSELVKRIAFLAGKIPDPLEKHHAKSAEEELAEQIARERHIEVGGQS